MRILILDPLHLSGEGIHHLQCFGQGLGIEVVQRTFSCNDVDVAKILQEVGQKVEDPLNIDIQVPMEVLHAFTLLGIPVGPVAAVDYLDEHQKELAEKWLRALGRNHAHDQSVEVDA